ncbi:hypothetical protein FXN63_24515 [Pigmentiphaga aceris]|uniref:Uncharacterized protein n=1 Tax=Pigmentiphaga aceris TaxID=1940612 RepID=A0A5C0B3Z2_9BURK|nr:hypothetical protein FXN63_24515 [Pigmentiphaga aceris]
MLLRMRREIDAELQPRFPMHQGKAYPYGRCLEISQLFMDKLRAALNTNIPTRGLRALRDFVRAGGRIDWVWGALREQFFQNAFQVGGLYVDVSNDTVTVTKPPVEILPFKQADFLAIQGIEHFIKVARIYWNVEVYINDVVPSLAPILPMIAVPQQGLPALASATDYMIDYFRRDRFVQAETYLREGPSLPPEHRAAMLVGVPDELRASDATQGREAAIAAVIAARDTSVDLDPQWRAARLQDYLRVPH